MWWLLGRIVEREAGLQAPKEIPYVASWVTALYYKVFYIQPELYYLNSGWRHVEWVIHNNESSDEQATVGRAKEGIDASEPRLELTPNFHIYF